MNALLASIILAATFSAPSALAQPPGGEAPQPHTAVSVDTHVTETPAATVEITTETITPVSTRPVVDPANPIASEVRAVVAAKKNYTTADIAQAQYEAMLATPASAPTSVVTTTTTTPKTPR